MSEQADKPLHDWVRQSLDTYRPNYNPTDWVQLQRALRQRRWKRRGFLFGTGLLLVGWLGWVVFDQPANKARSNNSGISRVKQVAPTDSSMPDRLLTNNSLPGNRPLPMSGSTLAKPALPVTHQRTESASITTPDFINIAFSIKPFPTTITTNIGHPQSVAFSPEERAISQQMLTGDFGPDSTSYRVLDRTIRAWPDAVIVCDLTTSMYPYSTQIFAWFRKHASNSAVKGMVFFTDCDSLGQQTRPGGPPGQMFITRERNPVNALPILLKAARNTVHNGDDAENDVEALQAAQEAFPEAKHLILLADNISTVKDMALLTHIRKPVHVVLCGTTGSDTTLAFQPDYYTIASRTNGSLHTLEDDLNPGEISSTATLRVGPHYYRYNVRKKRFKLTPFTHRPKRLLKFIWF